MSRLDLKRPHTRTVPEQDRARLSIVSSEFHKRFSDMLGAESEQPTNIPGLEFATAPADGFPRPQGGIDPGQVGYPRLARSPIAHLK